MHYFIPRDYCFFFRLIDNNVNNDNSTQALLLMLKKVNQLNHAIDINGKL